jgi:integrase
MHKLSALEVKNAKAGDKLYDGGGLVLDRLAWIFRFTSPVTKKERFMGLGPLADLPLAKARDAAGAARALVRDGKDPIEVKRQAAAAAKVEASRGVTFKAYAESYIGGREGTWKNDKHRQQWKNSLATYAYPNIGQLAVADVDTTKVLAVLRPIWPKKPETASRVRGRIENILSAAKAEGLRTGENPALWRGHLDQLLPSKRKVRKVKHHAALPYEEMPEFWQSLVKDTSHTARLLQFLILTAARYSEGAFADWKEVKGNVWRVPAERMKADRDHEVPLSDAALAVLGERAEGLMFPSDLTGDPLSDTALAKCIKRNSDTPATTHGFRSTFRDWAGDETTHQRETIEAALAHAIGDETEAAYRRSTALAKRRKLMEDWAAYCGCP